jgi:hypothetical protein
MRILVVLAAVLAGLGGASARAATDAKYTATLTAGGHTVLVGQPWRWTVRTYTATGRPVGGTVIAQVLLGGKVIDTIGWFRYSGSLSRVYHYGDADRGKTVTFRARVIAKGRQRMLLYAVRVI